MSAISLVRPGCAVPENTFSSPNPVAIRGSPITCASSSLVGWLGRKDSNLRIRDPKSRALPLGHAPTRPETSREILGEADLWSGHSHAAQTVSVSDGLNSPQLSSSRPRAPKLGVLRAIERPRQEYPSSGAVEA